MAVTATLADAEGTPKRHITETVRFSVDGDADIVGENPQRTRWGEAVVLIRPKAAVRPKPITVRAELTRKGRHVPPPCELAFTPGVLPTADGAWRNSAGESQGSTGVGEVERQQKAYDTSH